MGNASKRRRFIEYARVSKLGDRDKDELLSPDIQRKAMDAYAERHGIDVIDRIVDLDRSGRTFERRKVKDIIQRIERGEADGVLLWKWSRWARDVEQSKIYLRKVALAGGEVRAATEDIDTSTAIGQFQLTMQQGIDQLYSDQISEGWRAAQALRRERGLTTGGAPPLGYRAVVTTTDDKTKYPFVPDEVYGDVVREAYDLYLRGLGASGITKMLNKRGLTTPRTGGSFHASAIQRVLDSGFAAGLLDVHDPDCNCPTDHRTGRRTCRPPRRVKIKGTHERLIDPATWDAYQRERARRRQVNPNARQPRWFLGAGLTVCGGCGGNVVVDSYDSPKSSAICSTYRNQPGACAGAWIDRRKLELRVALWLGGHVEDWANAAEAHAGTTLDDDRAELTRAIDRERAEETKLRDGLRLASVLVAKGDMTNDDYAEAKREADATLGEVTGRLAELQAELDALDPSGDAYARLARALERTAEDGVLVEQPVDIAFVVPPDATVDTTDWPTEKVPAMAPEEFNRLLRRVIRRVVVRRRTVVIEPWRGEPTTIDRAAEMPPRKRTDVQGRDRKTGKFVKRVA